MIIGVIAALTIPSVIESTHDKELVTALKKTYSDLSRGFKMAESELGMISTWGITGGTTAENSQKLAEILTPYFNLVNICPAGESNCFAKSGYTHLDGSIMTKENNFDNHTSATMSNGQIIMFIAETFCGQDTSLDYGNLPMNSTVCATMIVDTNGDKKPNTNGKDVFYFHLTDYGVLPWGSASYEKGGNVWGSFSGNCDLESTKKQGKGCAAWVIYNENMDYLKCPGKLSWDGAHSCKEAAEAESNSNTGN